MKLINYYLLFLMLIFAVGIVLINGFSIIFYNGYWLSVLHGTIFCFFLICFGEAYFRYRLNNSQYERFKVVKEELQNEINHREYLKFVAKVKQK